MAPPKGYIMYMNVALTYVKQTCVVFYVDAHAMLTKWITLNSSLDFLRTDTALNNEQVKYAYRKNINNWDLIGRTIVKT